MFHGVLVLRLNIRTGLSGVNFAIEAFDQFQSTLSIHIPFT